MMRWTASVIVAVWIPNCIFGSFVQVSKIWALHSSLGVGGTDEALGTDVPLNDSAISQCPFSRSFPRYRIDLSSPKREEEENKFKVPSFLSGMKKSWEKSNFEQQYKNQQTEWLEDENGVAALASLWRRAATIISYSDTNSTSIVLGYPNCDVLVLRRWMDIIEWLQNESGLLDDGDAKIQATLLEKPTAIRLTRMGEAPLTPSSIDTVDETVIQKRTQAWVKRVLVDMSICPFTKSVTKSGQGLADVGVPVGRIAYHASNASPNQMFQLMADTWEAIADMLEAGPSGRDGISSILLAAPHFDDDFDLWSGPVFAMLEASVVAAKAQDVVGVVCFHPRYLTPDGTSFPGFGHMHSVPRLAKWLQEQNVVLPTNLVAAGGAWQRRTPHATINVLRADQLEAAEAKRDSGTMYTRNICKLVGEPNGIGLTRLEQDLERERQMGQ